MSAFMVSKRHIDYLITAGLDFANGYGPLRWGKDHRRELTRETASETGAILWAENRASVNYRYDENKAANPYEYSRYPGRIDPVQVLKAISCLEYQSCEHPEWEASEAKSFCEALRRRTIGFLPGFEDAAWEIRA